MLPSSSGDSGWSVAWQQGIQRSLPRYDQDAARRFKDARWALLKAPDKLTDKQATTLARLKDVSSSRQAAVLRLPTLRPSAAEVSRSSAKSSCLQGFLVAGEHNIYY